MNKYFGTDGIRGIANLDLQPEIAYKIGQYLGQKGSKVIIGSDTRISKDMLVSALSTGILAAGCSVVQIGVLSTPALSYITKTQNFDYGIMISASHNPFEDNGIKIFKADGFKLLDKEEEEIEKFIDNPALKFITHEKIGVILPNENYIEKYEDYIISTIKNDVSHLKVGLDLANGSNYEIAKRVLNKLNVQYEVIGDTPNGININDKIGSTHPENLQKLVRSKKLDIGLAFDGDADRIIVINESGEILDGDNILLILGKKLAKQGLLVDNVIVSTVMSNLGFYEALKINKMTSIPANVGDRYVLECMLDNGYTLGGEQSGHIIMMNFHNTGDGLLAGLQVLDTICEFKKSLHELTAEFTSFPQILENIKVKDKNSVLKNKELLKRIRNIEEILGSNGRILVRASGTEQLVRVMVEAKDIKDCNKFTLQLVDFIKTL